MAIQKKAKPAEPEGESAPMWIVSFADLVTLTMSFFVVLYALKEGGEKQQLEVAAAIKSTFDPNYLPPADSNTPWDMAIRSAHGMPGPPYNNMGGNALRPTEGAEGRDAQVETIRPGKQIVTGGKITFDAGKSELDDRSRSTIGQIADKVRGLNNVLVIKGHVSADEISLRPDDANGMSLSNQRAMRVADELARLGIDRRVLRPEACGPFEPLKTGVYDAAGLRQNRRVEIFTTDYTASDYFPATTVPSTASRRATEDPR